MPFNNYSPTYIFKGQVQSDTAPTESNDLVRKQDVSGLSFISSIASGSSSYLSVSGGELSVSSLLITDVKVDTVETSLANFISNQSALASSFKKGDFLVLTNVSTGTETFIISGSDGSSEANYTEVESGLTASEIVANLSAGSGITISSSGEIASSVTQYTNANARAALSGGAGISYNASTGEISSTITQYTDANARAALSVTGGGLLYTSSTGQFRMSISTSGALTSSGALAVKYDNSTIGINESNQLEFKGDSNDVTEGTTNLYFTDARSRAAVSAGTGLTYNSTTGQFACSITQYTDADAISAFSAGAGITLSAGGQIASSITQYTDANARASISAGVGSGLSYNSSSGALSVDNGFFRITFSNQSLTANVAKSLNHDLGEKLVHVSVYDSNDDLVHVAVNLTDADNLTITSSDSLTGVNIVVSI